MAASAKSAESCKTLHSVVEIRLERNWRDQLFPLHRIGAGIAKRAALNTFSTPSMCVCVCVCVSLQNFWWLLKSVGEQTHRHTVTGASFKRDDPAIRFTFSLTACWVQLWVFSSSILKDTVITELIVKKCNESAVTKRTLYRSIENNLSQSRAAKFVNRQSDFCVLDAF